MAITGTEWSLSQLYFLPLIFQLYFLLHGIQYKNLFNYLFIYVSPAYGYIESALVKCSNEGGLGPRYNREEDPWSSIFSMLMVDGVLSASFDLF